MRSRTRVALVATPLLVATLLGGCRAVIGVEDLRVADDASAGADASADGGAVDALVSDDADASDGGSFDAKPKSDVDVIAEGCRASDCRRCCKMAFGQQNAALEQKARDAQCICGAGRCENECMATACAATPSPPDGNCAPCLDGRLTSRSIPECTAARTNCKNEPSCAPIAICLEACP